MWQPSANVIVTLSINCSPGEHRDCSRFKAKKITVTRENRVFHKIPYIASATLLTNTYFKYLIPYLVIQSFSFGLAKDGLQYSSPWVFMGIRYFLAGAILVLVARKFTLNKSSVIIALFTTISTAFWIAGLEFVSPGDSAILNSTIPLFAIPIAVLVLKERPTRWEVCGIVIGFTGVLIYSISLAHGSFLIGAAETLIASVAAGAFSVLFRKARNEDPASLVGSQFLLGSLFFLSISLLDFRVQFTSRFIFDLAYMAIPQGAIQLYLWNKVLSRENVAHVTSWIFVIPILAVAIQSIETLEFPNAIALLGAFVMFIGIYVSNRSRTKVLLGQTRSDMN